VTRHWRDRLEEAQNHLDQQRACVAFVSAFQALEVCYLQQTQAGGGEKTEDRFAKICKGLVDQGRLPKADYDLALHLGKARNIVAHTFGFEPSLAQAERTVRDVRQLCARFAVRVCDVMVQPVKTAKLDDPLGIYLRVMREKGISQFPVVNGENHLVGTLDEVAIFTRLDSGDGKLPPGATVADMMRLELLPEVNPDAELDKAWRMLREERAAALLILEHRSPVGIVTKYDLLQNQEQ
jgi:predicted transcriptional regulator